MKKKLFLGLFGMALFVLPKIQLSAQTELQILPKIEKCIRNYQDHSSFGNPGSIYIDSATIGSFKDLFESNANLYWDLYKTKRSVTNFLLPVDEYLDSVNLIYNGLKPIISYGKYDIEINPDGKTAIVSLVKINSLQDEKLLQQNKFTRNITTLRLLLNIHGDFVLIQNISKDTRLTRIRSLYIEGGYPFLTNFSSNFFSPLVSNLDPSVTNDYSIGNPSGYRAGITADIRINRQTTDGFLLNVGLLYTKTNFDININNYVYAYRQTFDPGANAFECTVYDRVPSITEKIELNSISVPVTVKWYFSKKYPGKQPLRNQDSSRTNKKTKNPLRLKYYLKGGAQLSLLSGTTSAVYNLSHSGAGLFVYENGNNPPSPDKIWFYLDKNNERIDGPDFFVQKMFSHSSSMNLYKVYLSAVFAIGIEVKFNNFLIGLEPWLNIGITSVSSRAGNQVYQLYPTGDFITFFRTCNSPRINSSGLNIIIGKIFNRKY